MFGLAISIGILGGGAYLANMLIEKWGESQEGDGIARIAGYDVRPLLATLGILSGVLITPFSPLLGVAALAGGLGATLPVLYAQFQENKEAGFGLADLDGKVGAFGTPAGY